MDKNYNNAAILVCLSVFLCPALAEPRYLEHQAMQERVVGGQVASPNSWPWQVKHFNNNFRLSFFRWMYKLKVVKLFFLIW